MDKINGTINHEKAVWDGENYIPTSHCPVCKSRIINTEEPVGRYR